MGHEAKRYGLRSMTAGVTLTLNAWTALDVMSVEDDATVSKIVQSLVEAEAKRRMAAKQPEPKQA